MRALLYISLVLILSACSYSGLAARQLDEAQSLLGSNPGEALDRLNGIDVSEINDSATIARWALLYSEALAANNLHAPSDTIVNIALEYYSRHSLPEELKRTEAVRAKLLASQQGCSEPLAEARFMQKEREYRIFVERTRREQYALIAGLILAVTSAIIIWQRQKIKLRKVENDALMAEASGLRSQLSALGCDASRMQSSLVGLLDKRFALIDRLCDTYYQSQGTKNERKAIADRVKEEIEAVKTDAGIFADMENAVNECRGNLLGRLKEEYPNVKPEEYRLAVYLACGLSNRSISLLTGESINNVYKRKSRLKQRLKELDVPHGADFLSIF